MNVTPTVLKVLEAVAPFKDGCGAHTIAKAMGISCGRPTGLVAGGYAGRLVRAGWLYKEDDWYATCRGEHVFCGVRYWLTPRGRKLLSVMLSVKGVRK